MNAGSEKYIETVTVVMVCCELVECYYHQGKIRVPVGVQVLKLCFLSFRMRFLLQSVVLTWL